MFDAPDKLLALKHIRYAKHDKQQHLRINKYLLVASTVSRVYRGECCLPLTMNHVVLLLVVVVGLSTQLCYCIPILDTKGAYKMVLKRGEVVELNKSIFDCQVSLRKIDRYNFAASGIAEFKADLPLSTKVSLQTYEFLSNEYRPFAIHFEKTLCSLMETEYKYMLYPDLLKVGGSVPGPRCPLRKGNYSFVDYQPHAENFPAALPFKNSMVEMKVSNDGVTIFNGRLYLELDRDIVIREQFSSDSPGK